jgi:hypothetical protein
MFVPSENAANTLFIAITGLPSTLFAFALSQTEIALVAIVVNVCLAIGMKAVDVGVRLYLKNREDK